MKTTKQNVLLVIVITVLLIFMTGCQSTQTEDAQTTTSEATTQALVEQTEATTEAEPEVPPIRVYASVYPVYEFARMIGEGAALVELVVPPGADAHDFEPSARLVGAIENSDLFFYNGLGLEHWVESLIGSVREDLLAVRTSEGIETLSIDAAIDLDHSHSHSHSHDHGDEDPHVWLDPIRAKQMAETILKAYLQVDSDREGIYRANFEGLIDQLEKLDSDFERALAGIERRDIVVGHAAFAYLADRYALKQYAVAGISPLEEPSAAQLRKLTHIIRDNGIRAIFYDVLANPKFSEVLAQETGTITLILNPLEGITADQGAMGLTYFDLMYENLEALKRALTLE